MQEKVYTGEGEKSHLFYTFDYRLFLEDLAGEIIGECNFDGKRPVVFFHNL